MVSKDTRFRIALVQLRSGREVQPNLEAAEALIRQAAAGGAKFVLTPENTALMELKRKRLLEITEPEQDNAVTARFMGLAQELGIWLNIGSTGVKLSPEKIANRSLLIDPEGALVARYDKIHMFDVDLPNGETYRESGHIEPGREAVLADLPWGRLGMTICYDLRFPGLYRALAQAGADFISVPSAFTKQTGEAHWRVLLRARAIETGCFIFAPAQGGPHETGRDTYGHSLVVSPWGEVVAEAGIDPGVLFADIDSAQIAAARAKIPSLGHDRAFELVEGGIPQNLKAAS